MRNSEPDRKWETTTKEMGRRQASTYTGRKGGWGYTIAQTDLSNANHIQNTGSTNNQET